MLTHSTAATPGLAGHGAGRLAAVHIDTYNTELQDKDGFIGDRASGRAFRAVLENGHGQADDDPIGNTASADISKKKPDRLILAGDPVAAGVVLAQSDAVDRMTRMLRTSIKRAKKRGLRLASFIGIGCPI